MFKMICTMALATIAVAARAEVVPVEVDGLEALLARGVPLVDVRTAGEWKQSGVVPGSHRLTFFDESGQADPERWMKSFAPIAGPQDEVAIICRSGARSARVAAYLDQQKGYRRVYTIEGGVIGWKALGKPTEAEP